MAINTQTAIGKLFVSVPATEGLAKKFKEAHVGKGSTDKYYSKIVFLEETGEIVTHGKVYAENKQANLAAVEAILTGFGADKENPNKTVGDALSALESKILGKNATDKTSDTHKQETIDGLNTRLQTIEALIASDDNSDTVINKLQEVLDWFATVQEATNGSTVTVTDSKGTSTTLASGAAGLLAEVAYHKNEIGTKAVPNTAAEGEESNAVAATGLYKYIDDAVAAANKDADDAVKALDVEEKTVKNAESNEVVSFKYSETDGIVSISDLSVTTLADKQLVTKDADASTVINSTNTQSVSYDTYSVDTATTGTGLATTADISAQRKADMDVVITALNAQSKKIAELELASQWEEYVDETPAQQTPDN